MRLGGAEDYTALAAKDGAMQEVAQGRQVDEAQVPQGTSSVSVHGSAGTSVSLASPSLGLSVKGEGLSASATSAGTPSGGIIVPQCTRHALSSYYATDHLGTVRFVKTIDETGTEVATSTHDYEPFGVEITPTDSCDNTHKFTGHERDAETGNDYMHFRFYGASIGRFQKPDSVMGSLANPQSLNLYSYVKGNPVNYNDPTGHWYRVGGSNGGYTPQPHGIPAGDLPDLENYLWGGAEVTETVTHWTKTDSNGNVVNWGFFSGGSVAPSTPSGKAVGDWLGAIGVPQNQQATITQKLASVSKGVGMGPEKAIAIVLNSNTGVYDVISTKGTGSVGEVVNADFVKLGKDAKASGLGIAALGHAHMPTGSSNFLIDGSGNTKVAEGASVADAAGYKALGIQADRLFVLASGHVYVFGGADSFVSYTWTP